MISNHTFELNESMIATVMLKGSCGLVVQFWSVWYGLPPVS